MSVITSDGSLMVALRIGVRNSRLRRKGVVLGGNRRFVSEDYTDEHAAVFERRYDEGQRNIKINVVREQLSDLRGRRVLDLGAGIGYFSNLCHELGAGVVATDHSVSMVNRIRSRYGTRFPIVRREAHLLPFGNDAFDTVLALDVVEHLYEVQQTLAEIRRVMKRGGTLLVITDNPDFSVGVVHFSVARVVLNMMPMSTRDALRSRYQRGLRKRSRYATPQCTHVEYYSLPRLAELMLHAGFELSQFDTFPNRPSYGIYGQLVEKVLIGPLKRYKWPSALYVFKAE